MRKGRLEIWLGASCILLLAALAFGGYYRKDLQALWYRWRFNRTDDYAECEQLICELVWLGPEGHPHLRQIMVDEPENLQVLSRSRWAMTVRNDRPHRVLIRAASRDYLMFINPGLWHEENWKTIRKVHIESGHEVAFPGRMKLQWVRSGPGPNPLEQGLSGELDFVTILEPGEKAHLTLYP